MLIRMVLSPSYVLRRYRSQMANVLDEYLSVWNRKPALRAIYEDFYHRIAALCTSGLTIEIGGGIGNLKPRLPIRAMARLRVLHHLEFPSRFFREAGRLNGRAGGSWWNQQSRPP
jgi:hypothetical protein